MPFRIQTSCSGNNSFELTLTLTLVPGLDKALAPFLPGQLRKAEEEAKRQIAEEKTKVEHTWQVPGPLGLKLKQRGESKDDPSISAAQDMAKKGFDPAFFKRGWLHDWSDQLATQPLAPPQPDDRRSQLRSQRLIRNELVVKCIDRDVDAIGRDGGLEGVLARRIGS